MNKVNEILSEIGKAGRNADGSYTRPCYSPAYFQAVDIVEGQMKELGLKVSRDAAGNIHGVLPGSEKGAKSIIVGSHLDTVPSGGLYDGAYGVAAALEVVRRLKHEGKALRCPLELYGFNAEESNPIGGTFGSRAVAGLVDEKQPGLANALKGYGHTVEEIMGCKRDFSDAKCYLELHIEQGDYLYNEGIKVGVVSGIVGIVRYNVIAMGHSNHAGTTMMKNRRDAMVAMSRLIVEADRICRSLDDTLVFTAGTIECWPGSENVVPGRVACTFEMRHMNAKMTDRLIEEIRCAASAIETVEFTFEKKIDKGSVYCDEHLMRVIDETAQEMGVSHVIMPSGAGHDANPMAHRLPIGMIFIPSREGLSHCGEEYSEPEDIALGADLLFNTIVRLDDGE